MKMFKKLRKKYKVLIILLLVLVVSFSVPTLARFSHDNNILSNLPIWDGTIATSFELGDGSKDSPYIIKSASEFAYLSEASKVTDYSDKYFRVTSDLILNPGFFVYEEGVIKYVLDEVTYYVKRNTTEVYNDIELTDLSDVKIYSFDVIDNFNGNLDGSFYSIYGVYIFDEETSSLALFNKLSGNISDLFIENMLVDGGISTSGLATKGSNLNITNVYLDGYVIGSSTVSETSDVMELSDVNFSTDLTDKDFRMFSENDSNIDIVSSTLSGDYVVSDEVNLDYELMINNDVIELGKFEVDLGITPLNAIRLNVTADSVVRDISLINLKYDVVYRLSNASGLISSAENVTINNTVNDLDVYSEINASGFISDAIGKLEINNSYNKGDINGKMISTGIIGTANDIKLLFANIFNSGKLSGRSNYGIYNTISNSDDVSIINTLNLTESSFMGSDINSDVILTDVFNTTLDVNKYINVIDFNEIYKSEFLTNLSFNDYTVDTKNLWIYNGLGMPELFYEDNLNLVDMRIESDIWNSYNSILENVYYNTDITLAITSSSPVYTLSSAEYYVVKGETSLTNDELSNVAWLPYDGALKFSEEGKYIVYTKLTEYSGNIKYINTDVIHIDKTSPSASISFSDNTWESYRTDVSELLVYENENIVIDGIDEETGISEINYFVSNEVLSEKELSKLNDANWTSYSDSLDMEPVGYNILYASVTDNSGNVSYVNSDIITFDGYNLNFINVGRNNEFLSNEELSITANSAVTLNFNYNVPIAPEPEVNHVLALSKSLPYNTVITLTDNVNNKIYEYKTSAADTNILSIPFTSFVQLGSVDKYFVDSDYYDGSNIVENFTLTFDFEDSIISADILDLGIWPEVRDNSGNILRTGILSTLKNINIYENSDISINLSSSTSSTTFKYNVDAINSININTSVLYANMGGVDVINTTIENQNLVLKFKLLDRYDKELDAKYMSNFVLKIDGKSYYADTSGNIIVNMETGLLGIDKSIEMYAYKGDNFLPVGTYNLNVTSYLSYSDKESIYESTLDIPIIVSSTALSKNIDFKVTMNSDVILSKDVTNELVDFDMILSGATTPSVRISLYKKDLYDATSQTYTIVDLNDYLFNKLTEVSENVYLLPINTGDLYLVMDTLESQGYKFVLEAYDKTEKVGEVVKNFIVK